MSKPKTKILEALISEGSREDDVAVSLPRRAMVGVVAELAETLEGDAAETRSLRERLEGGESVVEFDPNVLRSSFLQDRLADNSDEAYQALKDSIRDNGQQVPILVRPYGDGCDQYEIAYGHRRARAAKDLGIKIKAVVRKLSDEQLVVAQGAENNERRDLSYIEKALFAARLEQRGFKRATNSAALGVHKSDLSMFNSVVEKVTEAVIVAIGPAHSIGRPRWLALSNQMDKPGAKEKVLQVLASADFRSAKSDVRFNTVVATLAAERTSSPVEELKAEDGRSFAEIHPTASGARVLIKDKAFAMHVQSKLPQLFRDFEKRVRK
jgi:ParB family chromosome partitioning protein